MGTHVENSYSLTLEDLNKFDFRKYNNLQEVEEADRNLNQCQKFGELLQKVYALTKENKIELGLRLIHRHISIEEEGKAMIEEFCHFNNRPAFITSASFVDEKTYPASWLIEKDKYYVYEYSRDSHVKKTLDEIVKDSSVLERIVQLIKQYNLESLIAPCIHGTSPAFITSASFVDEKTYPASWLIEKDKYYVYEYSRDSHVKKTLDEIVKDSSVLERIVQLIKQYNLESLIAPCIHARDALVHFNKNESLVETTYFSPSASVVQNGKTGDAANITTLWGGPITQA
ncbi:9272_t:CDS:2, partial [Entrophospora sp. SA101]